MFSSQRKQIFCWKIEGSMSFLLEKYCQNILFRLLFQNKSVFQFEMDHKLSFSHQLLLTPFFPHTPFPSLLPESSDSCTLRLAREKMNFIF